MRKNILKKIALAGIATCAGAILAPVAHAAAPFIYNVEIKNIASPGFQISWQTDSPSDSSARYDTWNINSFEYVSNARCDAGGDVTSHCVSVGKLVGNTTYYFEVVSCAAGQSCGVQFISGKTGDGPPLYAPPSPPSDLTMSLAGTSVQLKWTDNSDNESGFEIYRNDGGAWNDLGSVGENVKTFSDPNLPQGNYAYRVSSFIAPPGMKPVYSPPSNQISVAVSSATAVPATPQPTAQPEPTRTTGSGTCLVHNHYTAVPESSAPDSQTGYAKQAKLGVNDITGLKQACTDDDFKALLKTYCASNYNSVEEQVVTYNASGDVSRVECRTDTCDETQCPPVKSLAADTTPPSAPELNASALSPTDVQLTWTSATDNVGVIGYEVYRDETIIKNGIAALSYTDTTAVPGTHYTYFVRSYGAAGNYSRASNNIEVVTLLPAKSAATASTAANTSPAPKIVNVTTTDITGADAKVKWDTELPSGSEVIWGTKVNDYPNIAKWRCDGEGFVISHCLNLTGLTPLTNYYFRAVSNSPDGYAEYSPEFNFKTAEAAAEVPHNIISFVADTTPPRVTSFYIAPINGGKQAMFTVKFSGPMRPETLTPESIFVYPADYPAYHVPGALTIRPDGFDLVTQNLPDADHILVVKNSVKSLAGIPFAEDYLSVPVREHSAGELSYTYPPAQAQIPFYVTGWVFNVDVRSGKNIMGVRFNTDVDQSSMNAKNVFIASAYALTGSPSRIPSSYSTGKESVALTPSVPLVAGARYIATISAGVKSAGGVALGSDFTCVFTAIAEGYYSSCPEGQETPPAPLPKIEAARTATLKGVAVDNSGNAVSGATVSISGETTASAITGTDGSFDITLPTGNYAAQAFAPADKKDALAEPAPLGFELKENEEKNITLTFGAAASSPKILSGSVSFVDGEAISGAQIVAYNASSGTWATTFTDDKGAYEMKMSGGDWSVDVTPRDSSADWRYEGGNRNVSFGNDASAEKIAANFVLPSEDARITIHVADDGQNHLRAGVTLDSISANGASASGTARISRFGSSDMSGNLSFKVPPGIYYIRAALPPERGFVNPFERVVHLRSNAESQVLLIFKKRDVAATALLLGKAVKFGSGLAAPNAFVWGWSERGESFTTRTNERGEFSARARTESRWHIGASLLVNGFGYESGEAIIESGHEAQFITLTLVKMKTPVAAPVIVEQAANLTTVVEASDGAKVVLPPASSNATGTVIVSIVPTVDIPSAPGLHVLGRAYDITFKDSAGKAITEFPDGIEISLPYSDDDLRRSGISLENVVPSYFDNSGTWVKIAGYVIDRTRHVITMRVNHLTRFALVAPADFTAPQAVAEVRGKILGAGISLTWKNPEKDFHHVKVYRSASKGELGLLLDDFVLADASLYVDEDVKAGETYYYSIIEVDASGNESPPITSDPVTTSGHAPKLEAIAPAPPPPPVAPPPILKLYRGMRGKNVTALQQKLEDLGFFPADIGPTGYFGPITQGSVRAFQSSKGLPPTGIVAASTTAELGIKFQ